MSPIPPSGDPAALAWALLGEASRWAVPLLAFALAARLVLARPPGAATVVGALVLLAASAGAAAERWAVDAPFGEAVAAAGAAAILGAVLTGRAASALAFSIAAGALAAGAPTIVESRVWTFDAVGRVVPPTPPTLFAIAGLWLLLVGAAARGAWRAVARDAPRTFFGFAALAVTAGWLAAARETGLSSGVRPDSPTALWSLLAAILALALTGAVAAAIRGRLRQRASTVRRGAIAAAAVFAVVLAAAVSPGALAAAGVFAAVLLATIWPFGSARPAAAPELAAGGALAAAAFCAGALAFPDSGVAGLRSLAPLACAAAVAGFALAGLVRVCDEAAGVRPATTGRPRLVAAAWGLDFAAAMAAAAFLAGIAAPLPWAVAGLGALGFAVHLALDRNFERAAALPALVLAWSASGALLGAALSFAR